MNKWNELAAAVHKNAVDHGWWDEDREAAEIYALIHSELSEALEEYRSGRPLLYYPCNAGGLCVDDRQEENVSCGSRVYNPKNPSAPCSAKSKKPEGIAVELADCVIRILDYCEKCGIDLDSEIERVAVAFDRYALPALVNACHCLVSSAYESAGREAGCLADCVALIAYWCKENGSDLENAISLKHEYNKTRPYRHGGKKC